MTTNRFKYTALLLAAVALSACGKEALPEREAPTALTACIEQGFETKTTYDSFEGLFKWSTNDAISIHYTDGSFVTGQVDPNTGKVSVNAPSGQTRDYYAVYPSSSAVTATSSSPLQVKLGASYDISTIISGITDFGMDWAPCPMVAINSASSETLIFHHVGGLIRIALQDIPAATRSVKLTFDKSVTGTFTVSSPSSTEPTITAGSGSGMEVTFTLTSKTGVGSLSSDVLLNVPVPCGTFGSITAQLLDYRSNVLASETYTSPVSIARHSGKKLTFFRKKAPSFSVSPTKKVVFAPGNVQYKASTKTWRFAQHQWDFVGDATYGTVYDGGVKSDNTLISPDYNGWIDLFGWATAGVKNPDGDYGYASYHSKYRPTDNYPNYIGFGPIDDQGSGMSYSFQGWTDLLLPIGEYDVNDSWVVDERDTWNTAGAELVRRYSDWGVHFDSAGVGSNDMTDGEWFTLSYTEQGYLFSGRSNAENLQSYARIHLSAAPADTVAGIVILPDNFIKPQSCSFTPLGGYGVNTYYAGSASSSQGLSGSWEEMEGAGAVFLPIAGTRWYVDMEQNPVNAIVRWDGSYTMGYWTSSFGGIGVRNTSATITAYGWRLALVVDEGTPKPGWHFNFVVKCAGHSVRLVRQVD